MDINKSARPSPRALACADCDSHGFSINSHGFSINRVSGPGSPGSSRTFDIPEMSDLEFQAKVKAEGQPGGCLQHRTTKRSFVFTQVSSRGWDPLNQEYHLR